MNSLIKTSSITIKPVQPTNLTSLPALPQADTSLKEYAPKILKNLENKLKTQNERLPLKGRAHQANFREENDALQSILKKTTSLIQKNFENGDSLSTAIKEIDAEVCEIEKRLEKTAKNKSLTSKELEKELEITKSLHRLLLSLPDYLEFQKQYQEIDLQLDKSLISVNDSLFGDLHGYSPAAFSAVQESLKKMQEVVQLTSPLIKDESPFIPELLNQLQNGVSSVSSTCSDWLYDVGSHYENLVSSADRLWKEALEDKKLSDLQKFAKLKEASDLLLSMKEMLTNLQSDLPNLKKLVKNCQKKSDAFPGQMKKELSLLILDLDKAAKIVPEKLKNLETHLNKIEMEKTIKQLTEKAEISFPKEKELILNQIENYKKHKTTPEEKLNAYVSLKRQLNTVLALSKSEEREILSFCEKEEKRLNKQAEEKIQVEDLIHAQIIKEGQLKPNWLSRAFNYLDPANWSDTTKQVANVFLNGMQLSAQGIEFYQKIKSQQPPLKIPELSEEQQTRIDEGASKINIYLSSHYKPLAAQTKKDREFLERFTRRHPETRPFFQVIFDRYPSKLNPEEIKTLVGNFENYQKERLFHPEKNIDPREWIKGEKTSPSNLKPSSLKLIASSQATPISITAEKAEGVAASIVNGSVRFFSSFWPTKTQGNSISTEERIHQSQEKTVGHLQDSVKTLNQVTQRLHQTGLLQEAPSYSLPLQELKQETALLLESLRETMFVKPETSSLLPEWADWSRHVEKQCFEVKALEKQVAAKMKAYLIEQGPLGQDSLNVFGNKHKNLVMQANLVEAMELPGVHVPLPRGIASDQMTQFLKVVSPEIFEQWEQLGALYENFKGKGRFLEEPEAAKLLSSIQQDIEEAFAKVAEDENLFEHLNLSQDIRQWLTDVEKQGNYLMVRSTGAEDSKASANAGGNVSVAYVKPTIASFAEAMGKVVKSYFGENSLQNRLNADLNPFKEELRLAVTAQELIGEPVGGAEFLRDIPISLVLFTNEPLYIGDEEFRVMRFSATYGHGEGVVGNQGIGADTVLLLHSVAHPDQVYILYDNQDKPERLAPVNVDGNILLKKVQNSKEMQQRPVLDKEQILRLYQWGVVGEKFFADYPTDMEIVVKGGKIYPVQARPINRPSLLPTYIDLRKIAGLTASPIEKRLSAEMIVPGKASALEIGLPEEVLIAETLEKAEGLFIKGQHKLVIVGQSEPANSHPVVNFSSLGMPCLFAKDLSAVEEMVSRVNEKHPLAVCVQSATLFLWEAEKGAIKDYTSEGFVVHPAKISISLSEQKAIPKVEGVVSEEPREIRSLIRKIGSALTKETALHSLKALQEHPWIQDFQQKIDSLEKRVVEKPQLGNILRPIIETAKALNVQLEEAFSQIQATLERPKKEQTLELLFHVKALKHLLQSTSETGVSKHSILGMESSFKAAEALITYQEKLPHPAYFADVLMDGTQSPIEEIFDDWNTFLLKLEPIAEETMKGKKADTDAATGSGLENSKKLNEAGVLPLFRPFVKSMQGRKTALTVSDIADFKNTLAKMREGGVLPLFMTFFLGDPDTRDPVETVLAINKMMPLADKPLIEEIDVQKKEIVQLKNEMGQFGDPKSFPLVWQRLKTVVENFNAEKMPWLKKNQWDRASPISRSQAIKTINDLIDVYDSAIKAMKASQQFKDPVEKTRKFKEMLGPYLQLLKGLATGTVGESNFATHSEWDLSRYLKQIESILTKLSGEDPAQLQSSHDFSVAAATLGSSTDFKMSFPKTLEDIFTLIHQNLLASTAKLTQGLLSFNQLQNSRVPENLKNSLAQVNKISRWKGIASPQQIGLEIDKIGITIHYNVPLRMHSSKFSIHYNKKSRKMTMKSFFLGFDYFNRWKKGTDKILFLNACKILPLESKPKATSQEFSFIWDITEKEHLFAAYEEFGNLAKETFDPETPQTRNFINQMEEKFNSKEILYFFRKEPTILALKNLWLTYMIQKKTYIDEVVAIAKEDLKHASGKVRANSLVLFNNLVCYGYGFKEALDAAREGMKDQDPIMRKNSLKLFSELLGQKVNIDEAIAAITEGIKDNNLKVRLSSFNLLNLLVINGLGFNEALTAAKENIRDDDISVRSRSLYLLNSLVKKGHEINEAIKVANMGITDTDSDVRMLAEYFSQLFKNIKLQSQGGAGGSW